MVSDQAGPGSLRLLRIPVLWLQASHLESQGDAFIVKVIEAQLLFPKAHSKAVLWKPALHPSPAQRADVQETRRHPPVITLFCFLLAHRRSGLAAIAHLICQGLGML